MSSPAEDLHSVIAAWDDGARFSSFEDDDDNNDHFSNYEDNDRFTCSISSNESSSAAASEASEEDIAEQDITKQTLTKKVASLVDNDSESDTNPDMLRTYENCSAKEVLNGKQFRFSAAWVRKALAWCAKNQVSAHCLPRDSKEMIEFMHAVDWNVTDPLLLEALGTKLLSWVGRWITNAHLSPGMIESKVDPKKLRRADWRSVWAAHTEAWIDPTFDFVIGKTDPKPPKGMEHLPPRAPVPRSYKAPKQLVETAAEFVELFDFEDPVPQQKIVPLQKKPASTAKIIQQPIATQKTTVPVQKITQKTVAFQPKPVLTHKIIDIQQKTNPFPRKTVPVQKILSTEQPTSIQKKIVPAQKIIATENSVPVQPKTIPAQKIIAAEKSVPIQPKTLPTQKIISTQQKTVPAQQKIISTQQKTVPAQQKIITTHPTLHKPTKPTTATIHAPTTATIHAPTTTEKSTIPTAFFTRVLADGTFIKWITAPDPLSYPLTERQAVEFKECEEHPQFLNWWQQQIKAKLKSNAIEEEVMGQHEVQENEGVEQKEKEKEKVMEKVGKGKEKGIKGKKTAAKKTHPVVVVKKVHATRLAAKNAAAAAAAAAKKSGGGGGGVQFEGGKSFVEV